MAIISQEVIVHKPYTQAIMKVAGQVGAEDEVVIMALRGAFKEFLFLTDKEVHIVKKGFMTGNMFGENKFSLPYSEIASLEIKMKFGGGFLEISAAGVQNIGRSYWDTGKNDPTKAPNCISINSSLKKDFEAAVNKINELRRISKVAEQTPDTSTTVGETSDPLERIKKLKALLDMEAITQEEYDQKKAELLAL